MKKSLKRKLKKLNFYPYLLGLAMLLVIPMLRLTPFPDDELQLRSAAHSDSMVSVSMPIPHGSYTIFNNETDELVTHGMGSADSIQLSPGQYRMVFGEVNGFKTPEIQVFDLGRDAHKAIEGYYAPYFNYPLLAFHIFPDTVKYNIIDLKTNSNVARGTGSDFYYLPIGKYMVEFYDLEGYNKLPNQHFLIRPNTVTTVNGAFGKVK